MELAREWVRTHCALMRPAENSLSYVNCTPWTYNDIYVTMISNYRYKVYRRSALENHTGEPDIATGEPIAPNKFSGAQLRAMYKVDPFTFNCTPAETPITMGNWSTKPIAEVVIGDVVVGMENTDGLVKRGLAKATVLDVGSAIA